MKETVVTLADAQVRKLWPGQCVRATECPSPHFEEAESGRVVLNLE
jgi:hypothetical protein